jgi:class 3 adenylate cyclase/quercetin dioxygenase-like cupin family protein
MPRLQRRSFSSPDQVRRFDHGRIDVVQLDETAIGRFVFEPGWRWSQDVRPLVGTETCQNRHVGYVMSGHLHVQMADGTELDIVPGDAYEIPPGHDAWVVGEEQWDTVEFTSARNFAIPADATDERVLATILFTDIVDSTSTLARIGDSAWQRLLLEHNDRVRGVIDMYRGREIGTTGDGFLALFDSAGRAVRCAAAIKPAVAELGIGVRAGLHTGEVAVTGGQARGLAVHAAARIAALAGADEVLVSATTHDLLDGSGLVLEDRGSHELKGIEGARQVFALVRG